MGERAPDTSSQQRAREERRQRRQRRGGGQATGSGDGEADEHHVARHVGDEHVPELQVADGVDHAGDHRQPHQQGREGPVAVPLRGAQGARRLAQNVHLGRVTLAAAAGAPCASGPLALVPLPGGARGARDAEDA